MSHRALHRALSGQKFESLPSCPGSDTLGGADMFTPGGGVPRGRGRTATTAGPEFRREEQVARAGSTTMALLLAFALLAVPARAQRAGPDLREQASRALKEATEFYAGKVASHGG